ncbi:MAG TPA: ATP synthase F1 subunit delta [Roseiflexaceae bacterium]|nr:ATP synthase F1 subunit delta [Roseiflexaceae bacterium]HMP40149.1 ATP synthase F1 subunit delta [Roseiflexaceae bacterium]
MTTGDAQVAARALYDVLTQGALTALRHAETTLSGIDGEQRGQRLVAALPAETPREVRNLLATLAEQGAIEQLPAVIKAFERFLGAGDAPVLDGDIISAVELDESQRARITADLKQRYGDQLVLSFSVDAALIGGLIIRVGDQVLDNSLRTRLSAVQRNMVVS